MKTIIGSNEWVVNYDNFDYVRISGIEKRIVTAGRFSPRPDDTEAMSEIALFSEYDGDIDNAFQTIINFLKNDSKLLDLRLLRR